MSENLENQNQNQNQDDANKMLLEQLNELKKNSVSKEVHDKLKNDYADLMKSYINNEPGKKDETEGEVDVKKLREILMNPNTSNIAYADATLKLRKHVMETQGYDPFIGKGNNPQQPVTEELKKRAQLIADAMQYCLDEAQGDAEVFNSEWARCIRDVRIPGRY